MQPQSNILIFPVAPTPGASASADQSPTERLTREPLVEWLDPAKLRAVVDDRPDCAELLRSRAVPESDTFADFRLLDLFSDDPALGGKIGLAVMLLVAVGLGALLAGARL